jgi:hypothetical protein
MALARKYSSLKMNPLMSLAVFAIFVMMVPLFTIANKRDGAEVSRAQVVSPTPTPEVEGEMGK